MVLLTDLKVADNEANTSDEEVKIQIPTSNVSSMVMHEIKTYSYQIWGRMAQIKCKLYTYCVELVVQVSSYLSSH